MNLPLNRAVIFIGDELTATGFRLAGIETIIPTPGALSAALAEARTQAGLILLTVELADQLPASDLAIMRRAETPIIAIIPDARGNVRRPDVGRRVRQLLGIEA